MICERCYQPDDVGEHGLYLCPLQPRRAAVVWQDSIEGGIDIAHGLCHEDGTPKRYYSRTEIKRACDAKGVIPWTEVYAEDRTKDARVQSDWQRSSEAQRQARDRYERRMDGERPSVQVQRPQVRARESTKRIAADVVRALR